LLFIAFVFSLLSKKETNEIVNAHPIANTKMSLIHLVSSPAVMYVFRSDL